MSGIVGSYFNIRGSGVVGKLGTDGQLFTSTGAGKKQGFEAAAGGGDLTHAAWFRNNADHATSDTITDMTASWEVDDTTGYGLGDMTQAVTESSGIFTFAATGVYRIQFTAQMGAEYHDDRAQNAYIYTSVNTGSSYVLAAHGMSCAKNAAGNWTINGATVIHYFDVTNTSTHLCKFATSTSDAAGDIKVMGNTDKNDTYVEIIRIGGT
jgi:hypothetical protein